VTDAPPTPFHDLAAFTALPRCAGLALSPDGTRLVTAVATPDAEGTRYRAALWEVDPAGTRPARRLTRGDPGEHAAAFTPDGDLLFLSARRDPDPDFDADDTDDPPAALWRLPATGGEAQPVGARPGGLAAPVVAREAGTVVCRALTLPAAVTADDDAARRAARRTAKVTALLHDGHPVRFWDHDLGPDRPRLLAAPPTPPGTRPTWTDLTGDVGAALEEADHDVTPDGATVVTTWRVTEPRAGSRRVLVALDTAGPHAGRRRVLLDDPDHTVGGPLAVSPDGRWVACIRERRTTATRPPERRCVVVPVAGGDPRDAAPDWDRWVTDLAWTPDAGALVVTADDRGRAPLFRIDLGTGAVVRLTGDGGAYSDPVVAPDGAAVHALRSAVDAPPAPVRLDPRTPDQHPVPLRGPAARGDVGRGDVGRGDVDPWAAAAPHEGYEAAGPPTGRSVELSAASSYPCPGTLTEVTARAADGTPLRAWLVLPRGASAREPAPLLLWVHGGPLSSWNGWHWRWNPWVMAAHGYAVLLPDPALSTGYGRAFVARGWGRWGAEPYTDVLALTDAALTRADLDADRTAAMGGSFGGYLVNWAAGHTDRFRAIVTHASLWALDQFAPTTDDPGYWLRELTPRMRAEHSPHRHADAITTPVLVIHGDRDHRVPIGEALRLWWDLVSRHDGPAETLPHRFLQFPDENHWVLRPSHARLWYATVLAFLDHHLRGAPWTVPDALS
jgi:dipeptidyl aminopeptidase/acylaminoacyl peptidase